MLKEVPRYDLYNFITYLFEWKLFEFEICTNSHYIMLLIRRENKNDEIQTRYCLIYTIL